VAGGAGRSAALVVGAILGLGALFAVLARQDAAGPIGPGVPAPGFDLPRVGGEGALSLADLRGQVVLVNFWATWCKPCEDEMPAMERLYRRLGGDDFELVAVSVDTGVEEVEAFRERLGLSFPIVHDPQKQAARAYQAFRFPETVLVDRRGVVVARFIGPREWDAPAYVERIREAVAGATAPTATDGS